MGFGGRELARRAQAMPAFFDAINSLTGGEVIPVAGGVLIRNAEGVVLGAIGISGEPRTTTSAAHCWPSPRPDWSPTAAISQRVDRAMRPVPRAGRETTA
jgi:hypothetical protein